MSVLLIIILIVVLTPAVLISADLISRFGFVDLIGRVRSSKLLSRVRLIGLLGRARLAELIGRVRFADLISRSRILIVPACLKLRNLIYHFRLAELVGRVEFPESINRLKSAILRQKDPGRSIVLTAEPDLEVLNCRVQLAEQKKGTSIFDAFTVEICGSIHAGDNMDSTTLRVSVLDVTDGVPKAEPVQARVKQWQMQDSPAFCYNADLGKLPNQATTLSDWTAVARLHIDWLMFSRKGKRNLQFITSIHSGAGGDELASAECTFTYDNSDFGYIDLQENIQRTKTLAVALAFAVSAADNKLYDCEVELIKNWARGNILDARCSMPDAHTRPKTTIENRETRIEKRKLDRALDKTVAFFRDGNQLDAYKICREVVEIAPLAGRYDILELCLYVAQANGSAAPEELAILENLADRLEVDTSRFREMMEKILPVCMHKDKNAETVLGLTSDMNKEKTRQYLNRQYCKWNSRVTSSSPEIQTQADQMLRLIAEARSEYVG